MSNIRDIILASQSPFRRQLLASTGASFQVITSDFAEENIKDDDAHGLALGRARGKALAVAESNPECLVIGSDQVLGVNGEALGKVATKEDAFKQLSKMVGRSHQLVNGLVLAYKETGSSSPKILFEDVVIAKMHMRPLSEPEIWNYLNDSDEWQGVAGCYRYESKGVHLFTQVQGDHSTIVGLPLLSLLAALRNLGIDLLLNSQGPWTLSRSS